MERLTTRHNGVAVIKDKTKLKDAMEKLAAYEEAEEECDMKALTTEFAECICDKLCKYPDVCDQEELDEYCEMCKMDEFISDILKGYNQLNKFVGSQLENLLKKNSELERELQNYKNQESNPVIHGEWEPYPNDFYRRCSACKMEFEKQKVQSSNFCPNCGADMRGGNNE